MKNNVTYKQTSNNHNTRNIFDLKVQIKFIKKDGQNRQMPVRDRDGKQIDNFLSYLVNRKVQDTGRMTTPPLSPTSSVQFYKNICKVLPHKRVK